MIGFESAECAELFGFEGEECVVLLNELFEDSLEGDTDDYAQQIDAIGVSVLEFETDDGAQRIEVIGVRTS